MELTLKLRSGDIDSFIRSSINVNFLDSRKSSLIYMIERANVQVKLPSKEKPGIKYAQSRIIYSENKAMLLSRFGGCYTRSARGDSLGMMARVRL